MAITFFNAQADSTFQDLFEDTEGTATWYRLWTGDSAGVEGTFVDTSDFNEYGNGWIEVEDLDQLDIDFAQYDDEDLWVQTYNETDGEGDWVHDGVDFNPATEGDVTTEISADTTMDQMFVNEDEADGTWYRLWVGSADGLTGEYCPYSGSSMWIFCFCVLQA